MSRARNEFRRSILFDVRFLCPALLGSALMTLAAFGPLAVPLAVLGGFVSIGGGYFLASRNRKCDRPRVILEQFAFASDSQLLQLSHSLRDALAVIAGLSDALIRDVALQKLVSLHAQITSSASGTVAFTGTEHGSDVSDTVLAHPNVKDVRAVVRVRSKDHGPTARGSESLRAAFAAIDRGVHVERIIILPDTLWPVGHLLPTDDIRPWIVEQYNHGMWIVLVRESDVAAEPELGADLDIYDDRVVSTRDLDEQTQTPRFTITADPETVRAARARWDRLYRLATSYRRLLDRAPPSA